jgi:hypothetical protein
MFSSFFARNAKPILVAVNLSLQAGIQVALKKDQQKSSDSVKTPKGPSKPTAFFKAEEKTAQSSNSNSDSNNMSCFQPKPMGF